MNMNQYEYETVIKNITNELIPNIKYNHRKELNDFLIINFYPLNCKQHSLINLILQFELSKKTITSYQSIPYCHSNIKIWKGDITLLKIDSIVNAANKDGLGCFTKGHTCIDNIIHSKAGPLLREECYSILGINKINTGNLIITKAYNLPSKYILHCVGPIFDYKKKNQNQIELASCYYNCLEKVKEYGLKSIAFCCISTGLYGYPKNDACKIAIDTVKKWINNNNTILLDIVFCVYSDEDERIYLENI